MRLRDLYTTNFAHWMSMGNLVLRDRLSSIGIKTAFDKIVTKQAVTKIWAITSFPVDFDMYLSDFIRNRMREDFPDVETSLRFVSTSTDPKIDSQSFQRKFRQHSDNYERMSNFFDQMNKTDQMTGKTFLLGPGKKWTIRKADIKRVKEQYDSFQYVYEHSTTNLLGGGGQFTKTHVFIEASTDNVRILAKYRQALMRLLQGYDIYCRELQGNISQYLNNFGVAAYQQTVDKKFVPNLLSDENLSNLLPVRTQGLVGGDGVLMGLDVLSKLPFIMNYYVAGTAQVILWTGASGFGKTLSAQMFAFSLINDGKHVGAIDIKGNEWIKLKKFVPDLKEIKMGGERAMFVNCMRLDDYKVEGQDAVYVHDTAIQGTAQVLGILAAVSPNEGNQIDVNQLLSEAARKVMYLRGVRAENPKTFSLTRDINYLEVLQQVGEMADNTMSLSKNQRELAQLIVSRCLPYFTGSNDIFQREVSLQEVIDSPLVIYSFDKNNNVTLDTLDDVRVYMVQFLSLKKQFVRKQQKKHTVDFYEELQRSNEFGRLMNAISHAVTGSRSNNVMVVLLMNTFSALESNRDTESIKSNITTYIAGRLEDNDVDALVKLGRQDMLEHVKLIQEDEKGIYRNCFAIRSNNGQEVLRTIFRVELPDYMLEELKTRDVELSPSKAG